VPHEPPAVAGHWAIKKVNSREERFNAVSVFSMTGRGSIPTAGTILQAPTSQNTCPASVSALTKSSLVLARAAWAKSIMILVWTESLPSRFCLLILPIVPNCASDLNEKHEQSPA
jgi:hypothetical protein